MIPTNSPHQPQPPAFDIPAARANLRRRFQERRKSLDLLTEQARKDVQRITAMLIERYQPRRIYQWGSLLEPNGFREWSDLDFAVEGLGGPLDGLRAADEASDLTLFPVDLVELERIHPLHAESIRANGRLIHERD